MGDYQQAEEARRPAPLLSTVVFIALGLIVPLAVTGVGDAPRSIEAASLITMILVLAAARYAWVVGSRDRHIYEMVLWLFVYFFLGVAPLLQMRLRWPTTTPGLETSLILDAAVVSLVGVLALILGSWLAARMKAPVKSASIRIVNGRRTKLLTLAVLLVVGVYVVRIGPATLFNSRGAVGTALVDSFGGDAVGALVRSTATMGLLVVFIAQMQLRRQLVRDGVARHPRLVLVALFILLFVLINPVNSPRYTSGTVILAVLAAFGAYGTVKRFRTVAVSAVAAVIVVLPILDTFRFTLDAEVQFEGPLESLTTGDYDAFAQSVNAVELVAVRGYEMGAQLLGPLFFWVPRQIWPSKPIDTGVLIAEFKGYGFTNLSASLWTEFYLNFGVVGVGVGMVAVGFLLRRLDARSELQLRISNVPPVLGCIVPFYLLIILRGSLLQSAANLGVILVCAWFVRERQNGLAPSDALNAPLREIR